ncbi:hypothetical protein GPALN_003034 [Globodera pallida]|nr:hypothetical protein GPALN_003034 [Globodera pallida]
MEAGETILSVPPLLHLLTIQQQQQKGRSVLFLIIIIKRRSLLVAWQRQCRRNWTTTTAAANANVVKQEANNNNKSASAGLASDEEDRLEHKQQLLSQDDEDDDFVGKLEIVENSTTPLPHYLQIQIPPVSGAAFVRGRHHHLHTASSLLIPTDDPSTPTDQALKALPVIKLPWDEKEERPSLSYKDLIIEAIESSPERRLKLSEIYQPLVPFGKDPQPIDCPHCHQKTTTYAAALICLFFLCLCCVLFYMFFRRRRRHNPFRARTNNLLLFHAVQPPHTPSNDWLHGLLFLAVFSVIILLLAYFLPPDLLWRL